MNLKEPTNLKIILKKTGKNAKKLKSTKIGLSYTFLNNNKFIEHYEVDTSYMDKG